MQQESRPWRVDFSSPTAEASTNLDVAAFASTWATTCTRVRQNSGEGKTRVLADAATAPRNPSNSHSQYIQTGNGIRFLLPRCGWISILGSSPGRLRYPYSEISHVLAHPASDRGLVRPDAFPGGGDPFPARMAKRIAPNSAGDCNSRSHCRGHPCRLYHLVDHPRLQQPRGLWPPDRVHEPRRAATAGEALGGQGQPEGRVPDAASGREAHLSRRGGEPAHQPAR